MVAMRNRPTTQLRPLSIQMGYTSHAEGSALVGMGNTLVLVTASITDGVPKHALALRQGWLVGEYNLLPRATHERKERERYKISGRTAEIQRFMGRVFRAVLDLSLLPNKTLVVDADVLQADGGTRVASLIGGYAALHMALDKLVKKGVLDEWPLLEFGALGVGWNGQEILVDMDYREDDSAWADLTVVATTSGVIEVHGCGEGKPIPTATYQQMLDLGLSSIASVIKEVHLQMNLGKKSPKTP
jgi:ribonuclease PH